MFGAAMMGQGLNSASGSITQGTSGSSKGFASFIPGSSCNPPSAYGKTIDQIYDSLANGILQLSGFSADPGVSFVRTIKVGSVTKSTATDVALYSYGAGVAQWQFSSKFTLSGAGLTNWTLVLR